MTLESSHPPTRFLVDMFAASTTEPVYLCSLPNHDADQPHAGERHIATRELRLVEQFVTTWDRPHRGVYFCVSTIKPGVTKRNKETVAAQWPASRYRLQIDQRHSRGRRAGPPRGAAAAFQSRRVGRRPSCLLAVQRVARSHARD